MKLALALAVGLLAVQKLKRRTKRLKAVNPNAKVEEDAWTPEELLDFIEQKGEEVAPGIGSLAAFMIYQFTNGKKPLLVIVIAKLRAN